MGAAGDAAHSGGFLTSHRSTAPLPDSSPETIQGRPSGRPWSFQSQARPSGASFNNCWLSSMRLKMGLCSNPSGMSKL
jgi:hypothetical protein